MTPQIDIGGIGGVEFGVCLGRPPDHEFRVVRTDVGVKDALVEMLQVTAEQLSSETDGLNRYEPSEKYASVEPVVLPLDDPLAATIREIHEIGRLVPDGRPLDEPSSVSCYLARFEWDHGRRLTAIRQATQFKGVLKKRLIRIHTDSLRMVEDQVFKLDNDFDMLADSNYIHILRPRAFESIGRLENAIRGGVGKNISEIQQTLDFVEFGNVAEYAASRIQAARYLASIRQQDLKGITPNSLVDECMKMKVQASVVNGRVAIADGAEAGFLQVLDRRRYRSDLVSGHPEQFVAASRRKL